MNENEMHQEGEWIEFEVNCNEGVVTRAGIVLSYSDGFYTVKTKYGNIVRLCNEEIK